MCSGKVYYDLLEFSREHGVGDVGIVRVEQLYPLDRDALTEAIAQFPNCEELVWVQEEPRNMGAWGQLLPSFLELFGEEDRPSYVGRVESSSPATGSKASHKLEQKRLLEKAFKSEKPSREVAE
jgi:2-oxoglutarate dehydrogenase E1 component